MLLPYNWLKELVKTKLSPEQLADKLTMIGLEVESVETAQHFSKVVIGQVVELGKHPNADRLHVTKVDVGKGEPLGIVCGANNLSVGIKVPVALVGARIDDFEIKKASLRGVESNGMICSEKELGLGDDHSGIMILPEDAPVGKNLEDYLDFDAVIDISVPANRPDCMSVVGLAREVAAATDEDLKLPRIMVEEKGKKEVKDIAEIVVEDPDLCPRYMARIVSGVKIGPSPLWMQKRLTASGMRPINNLVDISNYVMLELGQPLHFFDYKKLVKNHKSKIVVRRAKDKEKMETLDGVSRELDKDVLVIADDEKPIAIAGIMGGAETEIDENTSEILIEAAVFDKATIRRGSKAIGLRSEAVSRFEKGLPLNLPEVAIDRAAQLLAELAEGTIEKGTIDQLDKWIWVQHIGLKVSKLRQFLDISISENQIIDILNRLGFEAGRFDIVAEAKKHLGKPYVFGASYKKNGTSAFDCSYLTDYIYSLIGMSIGHTSLGQLHHVKDVEVKDLKPGDNLFYKGHIDKSVVGEYYVSDGNGNHEKKTTDKYKDGVGHNGMYIGNGQVIHASAYDYEEKGKKWVKREDESTHSVHIVPVEKFTKNPEYLGAKRYVEDLDDYIAVTSPWWREDVKNEYDLYEEIARIWGFDKIPATLPSQGNIKPVVNDGQIFTYNLKNYLADIGLTEIATYSFVSKKEANITGIDREVKVVNPIVKGRDILRNSLLPQMLESLAYNQYHRDELKFFEVSRVFNAKKEGQLPEEPKLLCAGFIDGDAYPYNYTEGATYYAAKGVLDALLHNLFVEYKPKAKGPYLEGRSAEVYVGGESIGMIGEIREDVASNVGLKKKAAVFEINLEKLAAKFKPASFSEISKYPAVSRDLSAVFSKDVPVQKVVWEVKAVDDNLAVEVIDIYEGKPLEKNEKSVSLRLTLTNLERTMTEVEVEKVMAKCKNKIEHLGGVIRSGRTK